MVETRRQRGAGSIYHRERDGLWCGQLSGWAADGKRTRRTVYGHTREEVEAKVAEMLGGDMPPPRPRRAPTTMEVARSKGTHTRVQWEAKRDAIGCCIYCGSLGPLVKDHATPVHRGGSDGIENVVPACSPCNQSKGADTAAEFVHWREIARR